MKTMSQAHFVKTALRLPPDLHTKVHESARANERTFNGELIHQIRQAYTSNTAAPQSGNAGHCVN